MAEASAKGSSEDASVDREETPDESRVKAYLSIVADEAEAAVKAVEDTINHLKESLAYRRAEAAEARAAAAEKGPQ